MKKAIGLLIFVLMVISSACTPQVTITEPQDGATFDEGATIVLSARQQTEKMENSLVNPWSGMQTAKKIF